MTDRLHYTACGLDEIYLLNGFDIVETGYGPGPVIKNPEQLYDAVAASVLGRARLSGQEAASTSRPNPGTPITSPGSSSG